MVGKCLKRVLSQMRPCTGSVKLSSESISSGEVVVKHSNDDVADSNSIPF